LKSEAIGLSSTNIKIMTPITSDKLCTSNVMHHYICYMSRPVDITVKSNSPSSA